MNISITQYRKRVNKSEKVLDKTFHVVKDGTLRGFVSINPRWAGFKVDDYYEACLSSYEDGVIPDDGNLEIEANEGDFDLRGYEIAHGQFFDTPGRSIVTIANDEIRFNMPAIRKFESSHTVELLIHPEKKLLAVRTVSKEAVNTVTWSKLSNTIIQVTFR